MRQHASIALAFATPASTGVLDEPFNWLDPVAGFDTRAALATKVASGTTLLTALHDLTTLLAFATEASSWRTAAQRFKQAKKSFAKANATPAGSSIA